MWGENRYIAMWSVIMNNKCHETLGNDISVYTCHVERSEDISKQISPLPSFGRYRLAA